MTFEQLNARNIHHRLAQLQWTHPVEIICLDTVTSTNEYLKHHRSSQALCICIADHQTQGRGRLGREWMSPAGGNLYCSIQLTVQHASHLGPCSLVVGLSLLSALQNLGITQAIQLKWPNDLMFDDKKLGGILIEIVSTNATQTTLIIGIGMNLHICPTETVTNQAITSLELITSNPINRNQLVAHLLYSLQTDLSTYQHAGWAAFAQKWARVDCLYGKEITLYQAGRPYKGTGCGVNNQGQLILKDELGNLHAFSSGEATRHHPMGL